MTLVGAGGRGFRRSPNIRRSAFFIERGASPPTVVQLTDTHWHNGEPEDLQRGARVIRLRQDQRGFETWVRQDDGSVVNDPPLHEPQGSRG